MVMAEACGERWTTKRLASERNSEVWALSRKTLKNCLGVEGCLTS